MGTGAWQATVHGCKELDATEHLSTAQWHKERLYSMGGGGKSNIYYNHKWTILYKNFESLCCMPATNITF